MSSATSIEEGSFLEGTTIQKNGGVQWSIRTSVEMKEFEVPVSFDKAAE